MNNWELYKRLEFDHNNKRYIHKPENKTHKFLWDFQIQIDYSISAGRLRINLQGEINLLDFAIPTDHWVKIKEIKKLTNTWILPKSWKKALEHKGDSNTNRCWALEITPKNLEKRLGEVFRKRILTI